MGHQSCCVVNCRNTSRKSDCKFYKFPTARWKINQRNQWIAAVRRLNDDGSQWVPKPYDCICSAHFIGGKKSEEELSPGYIPTIFPSIYKSSKVNETSALNRYKRVMNRRMKAVLPSTSNAEVNAIELVEVVMENPPVGPSKLDQGCQVNFYSNSDINSQTFTCNRYIKDDLCHAETQTEIVEDTRSIKIHIGKNKFIKKECGTPEKTFVDKESQADGKHFNGFTSVTNDQEVYAKKYVVPKKERLLIF